ncbi:MAG: hypothetical protein ACJAZE_001817 [Halioglobus sp.]|jgi:hypothetical protein
MDSNALSNTLALAETGYSRDRFGSGWADVDRDCQNSREETFIEQSTTQVRKGAVASSQAAVSASSQAR